ncbi:MAG: PilZ domain-containing protein [Syntrophobacteraceae bacterium]
MTNDMREHRRYRVREGVLAALCVPGDFFASVGWIVDISMGGLCLLSPESKVEQERILEIKLMGYEDSTVPIERFPSKVIYTKPMEPISVGPYTMNRHGFQFARLSGQQQVLLEDFILANANALHMGRPN